MASDVDVDVKDAEAVFKCAMDVIIIKSVESFGMNVTYVRRQQTVREFQSFADPSELPVRNIVPSYSLPTSG